MLGLVSSFPAIASVVLLLCGGALSGGLEYAYVHWIELPHALALQREELTSQFEKRAIETKHEVELARFKYIEQLTDQFYQKQAEDAAWHQAQLFQLNQEIADYEKAEGGKYGLDQHALDFLGRVRAQPASAPH